MNTFVPETVNFNELIKSNNNKMSINIQNKLVTKMNETFQEEEQRWYAANLYIYMNYHPTDDFPIDLNDVYEMIGFINKANAKKTLINNFAEDIDYKTSFIRREDSRHGGSSPEKVMLNTDTFKNLCMIARTENGKKIRKYYVKLENVFNSMIKETMDEQVKEITYLKKEEVLLQEYNKECSVVYLIKVKTLDENRYILKIGESRSGIAPRYKEHKKNYPECVLLDCFPVKNSKRLEKFLHNKYAMYRYNHLGNHEKEHELFIIGEELTYQQILNSIQETIHTYDDTHYATEENLKLQIQHIQLQNENLKLEIEKLKSQKEVVIDYTRIEQIVEKVIQENKQQNTTNNFNEHLTTVGPRVQQINPENMQLVKVYENVSEACNYFKIPRSSLMKAYRENTIYKDYRWNMVERDQNPNEIVNLPETKQLFKIYNLGYIAKMNIDKTQIVNVYLDRKSASFLNGYKSVAHLDKYVKDNKICDNYFYVLYETLGQEIKDEFLHKNNLTDIVLYKSGVGQYDANDALVKEFRSKQHCQEVLKIGEKTLNKALLSGNQYMDFYYRYCIEKLEVVTA
jgi:phage anti-repressor protein